LGIVCDNLLKDKLINILKQSQARIAAGIQIDEDAKQKLQPFHKS